VAELGAVAPASWCRTPTNRQGPLPQTLRGFCSIPQQDTDIAPCFRFLHMDPLLPLIQLRPVNTADLPFLINLRRLTMGPHLEAAGIELDEQEMLARIHSHFDSGQIIESAGEAIGLLKVVRETRTWTVVQVQILPAWQNQGVGTRLVAETIADASKFGAEVVLSVLKVNKARRLYERLGFSVISESDSAYTMRT
jgi:ribosomal protein S18 acetylase RimI-like enzyme